MALVDYDSESSSGSGSSRGGKRRRGEDGQKVVLPSASDLLAGDVWPDFLSQRERLTALDMARKADVKAAIATAPAASAPVTDAGRKRGHAEMAAGGAAAGSASAAVSAGAGGLAAGAAAAAARQGEPGSASGASARASGAKPAGGLAPSAGGAGAADRGAPAGSGGGAGGRGGDGKPSVKDRVKHQRLAGQSGIGSDFREWRSEEEMSLRQRFDD
jgi:hypothetical protein